MSAGRFERYDRYERALRDVLKILNLAAPPAPSGDARNDPRARRHWHPSHTQWHIRPALAAFGRRRVQTRLLEHLRTGTDYEIIGAADAWYCTYLRVAGSDPEDDPCTDLRHAFQETGLHIFLANDNPRVRRRLLTLLNLRANESPPELRPLVSEVLRIVRAHAG
ncbi:hypothetical protein [Micromonospora sp. NBC_00860]|uniref:hypothetical protein n=1 Tax=Micromonospora sp. NBC_00860 TaxID=2975980 RepID=UPI00386BF808|nr:hypothetical protein OH804_19020 [Micromonospora sp. NBC_00860]